MPERFYLPDGTPVTLGAECGGGGEGSIRVVAGRPAVLAKLYRTGEIARARHAKLQAMLLSPPDDPMALLGRRSIAWPQELLYTDSSGQQFRGFLMPRADEAAHKAHLYFQPEDRQQIAPGFDFRYLVTVGRNIASAIGAIHAAGHCVGDINESNILITPRATVTLIDTDSFQIRLPGGQFFPCPVGKREYLAPELLGRPLAETARTEATDAFALAVLLFQLLMQGFHPFSGTPPESGGEPPPLEEKIRRQLFVYLKQSGFRPPQRAPSFDTLPAGVQDAFVQAFAGSEKARPTAQRWALLLDDLRRNLAGCARSSAHVYSGHLKACPWCELAGRTGVTYFPKTKGFQVKLPDPGSPESPNAREEYLLSHITIALADGSLAPESEAGLAKLAKELGLEKAFAPLLEAELQRTGARRGTPQSLQEPAEITLTPSLLDFGLVEPNTGRRTLAMAYVNPGRGALRGTVRVEPPGPFLVSPERLEHNQGEIRVMLETASVEWDRVYNARLVVAYNGAAPGAQSAVAVRARAAANAVLDGWLRSCALRGQRLLVLLATLVACWGWTERQEPVRVLIQATLGLLARWLPFPILHRPDLVWQALISLTLIVGMAWGAFRYRPAVQRWLLGPRAGRFLAALGLVLLLQWLAFIAGLSRPGAVGLLVALTAVSLTAMVPLAAFAACARFLTPPLRRWLPGGGWGRRAGAVAAIWSLGFALLLLFAVMIGRRAAPLPDSLQVWFSPTRGLASFCPGEPGSRGEC